MQCLELKLLLQSSTAYFMQLKKAGKTGNEAISLPSHSLNHSEQCSMVGTFSSRDLTSASCLCLVVWKGFASRAS